MGRFDEAETSYTQAIALKPDFAEAYSNLGNTLRVTGRFDEAETSFTEALALQPDLSEAHRMLASIKKFDAQDEQYSLMRQLYLNEDISDDQRCHINFGLAKACEDLGNYEQAYAHYCEGNALRKKLLKYDINNRSLTFITQSNDAVGSKGRLNRRNLRSISRLGVANPTSFALIK